VGAGKWQERDVVGSLWIWHALLSKCGADLRCPPGRHSLCCWKTAVVCRTPSLPSHGELLPTARGRGNSAFIDAWKFGSFSINYQDCNALSILFSLLFLKVVHGPWRCPAIF